MTHKIGRNDPCPCGSGKKFKKCQGAGGSGASQKALENEHCDHMRYDVQDVPANTQAGMDLLENLCNQSATESGTRPN